MDRVSALIEKGGDLLREGLLEKAARSLSEAIDIVEGRSGKAQDKRTLAEALRLRAYCRSRLGEFTEAARDAKRAMDISKGLSDLEGEADALRRLGYLHWQKADYIMAMEFYNAALEKASICGANHLLGKIKIEIGNVHTYKQEFVEAERLYLDAERILRAEKDYDELARLYNNIGALYLNSERYEDAIKVLKQCAACGKKAGDNTIQGWANFNIAEGLRKLGRPKDAIPHLQTALDILRRCGDKAGIASTHLNYGLALAATGDWDGARDHFNRALRMERTMGMPATEGEALREIGKAYMKKGDKDLARSHLEKALKVYEEADLEKEAEEVRKLLKGSWTGTEQDRLECRGR